VTQTLQRVALFLGILLFVLFWYLARRRLAREKAPDSRRQAWNLAFLAVLVGLVLSLTLFRRWTTPQPPDFIAVLGLVLFGLFLTLPRRKVIRPIVLFSVAFTLQMLSIPLLQRASGWGALTTILLSIVIDGASLALFVMLLVQLVRNLPL